MCIPRLKKRICGGQDQERQADKRRQDPKDADDRLSGGSAQYRMEVHSCLGNACGQKSHIDQGLSTLSYAGRESVCAEIPEKQRDLKENQARGPHRSRTAEQWQQALGGDRLHQEKQEATEKNGD